MSAFRGGVYWKDQCKFCKNGMFCKYKERVELVKARLEVVELESRDCYGILSFWCDYYHYLEKKPEKDSVKILSSSTEGLTGDFPMVYYELSCGHKLYVDGLHGLDICPVCLKKVERN